MHVEQKKETIKCEDRQPEKQFGLGGLKDNLKQNRNEDETPKTRNERDETSKRRKVCIFSFVPRPGES
jgi:hypothetical protein